MKMPKAPKPKITAHVGKGGASEMLPHRRALSTLTKGDPMQRTMNNYAKETPGVDDASPDIFSMGSMGR